MTKRLIIVLGYTLNNDGSIQPVLQSRLDEAKSIYQPTDTILVCGKYPPKDVVPTRCEHPTEAEAMKQYLILQGIPAEYILKEEDSVTTFGNALFSFLKIRNEINQYHSIVVVSNEFHGPLVEYSFNTVFGAHLYTFHASPDVISVEALEKTKKIINQLVEKCYPLLFGGVKNGDLHAIQSIIEDPQQRQSFESNVKELLHLDESANIVIASEEEITENYCHMNKIR